jgi:hypothetical protein
MLKTAENLGLSVEKCHQLLLILQHITPFYAWKRTFSLWVGDRLGPKAIWM